MAAQEKSSGAADLDGLIHSLEYENQMHVKMIEKENHKNKILEAEEQEKIQAVADFEIQISSMEAETKSSHKQYVHNKDTLESLKKSKSVLHAHKEALLKQLDMVQHENNEKQRELNEILGTYEKTMADYESQYKAMPLYQQLLKEEEKLAQAEEEHSKWQARKMELQAKIKLAQDELDFKDWSRFCIKIAEKWVSINKMKEELLSAVKEKESLQAKLREIRGEKNTPTVSTPVEISQEMDTDQFQEEGGEEEGPGEQLAEDSLPLVTRDGGYGSHQLAEDSFPLVTGDGGYSSHQLAEDSLPLVTGDGGDSSHSEVEAEKACLAGEQQQNEARTDTDQQGSFSPGTSADHEDSDARFPSVISLSMIREDSMEEGEKKTGEDGSQPDAFHIDRFEPKDTSSPLDPDPRGMARRPLKPLIQQPTASSRIQQPTSSRIQQPTSSKIQQPTSSSMIQQPTSSRIQQPTSSFKIQLPTTSPRIQQPTSSSRMSRQPSVPSIPKIGTGVCKTLAPRLQVSMPKISSVARKSVAIPSLRLHPVLSSAHRPRPVTPASLTVPCPRPSSGPPPPSTRTPSVRSAVSSILSGSMPIVKVVKEVSRPPVGAMTRAPPPLRMPMVIPPRPSVPKSFLSPTPTAGPRSSVVTSLAGAPRVSVAPRVSMAPRVSVAPCVSMAPRVSVAPQTSMAPPLSMAPPSSVAPPSSMAPMSSTAPITSKSLTSSMGPRSSAAVPPPLTPLPIRSPRPTIRAPPLTSPATLRSLVPCPAFLPPRSFTPSRPLPPRPILAPFRPVLAPSPPVVRAPPTSQAPPPPVRAQRPGLAPSLAPVQSRLPGPGDKGGAELRKNAGAGAEAAVLTGDSRLDGGDGLHTQQADCPTLKPMKPIIRSGPKAFTSREPLRTMNEATAIHENDTAGAGDAPPSLSADKGVANSGDQGPVQRSSQPGDQDEDMDTDAGSRAGSQGLPFSPFDAEKHRQTLQELCDDSGDSFSFQQRNLFSYCDQDKAEGQGPETMGAASSIFNMEFASSPPVPMAPLFRDVSSEGSNSQQPGASVNRDSERAGSFFSFEAMDTSDSNAGGLSLLSMFDDGGGGGSNNQPDPQESAFSFDFGGDNATASDSGNGGSGFSFSFGGAEEKEESGGGGGSLFNFF